MAKILVIDDDRQMLKLVEKHLELAGHSVITSVEPLKASLFIRQQKPDLVLVDQDMPALTGDSFIKVMKNLKMNNPVVLFSNLDETEIAGLAMECGADDYIIKSHGMSNLLKKVEGILKMSAPRGF